MLTCARSYAKCCAYNPSMVLQRGVRTGQRPRSTLPEECTDPAAEWHWKLLRSDPPYPWLHHLTPWKTPLWARHWDVFTPTLSPRDQSQM